MSQPNTGPNNWQMAENDRAITAGGTISSEPTTGKKHFQILENESPVTQEPDSQGIKISGGQPSTTGPGHFQRLENSIAGKTDGGLGGTPKGWAVTGNSKGYGSAGRNPQP